MDLFDGDYSRLWNGDEGVEEQEADLRYQRLIDCYALGSYLGDDKFCDALISSYFSLREDSERWPSAATCNQANRTLSKDSKLRLLIVHHIAFSVDRESLANSIDELDLELVKDIALEAVATVNDQDIPDTAWDRGEHFYHIIRVKHEDSDSDSSSGW